MRHLAVVPAALLLLFACTRTETATDTPTPTRAADSGSGTAAASTQTTVTSPAGEASPPATGSFSAADRAFAEKAARLGMAEVQLATKVSARAQTQEVRSFAQRMIADHDASNRELTLLGAKKGFDPPADLDADKKALDEKLSKLAGPPLDRAYMQAMVDDHAAAVSAFEAAASQLGDPDLKGWAAKTLPTLRAHHQMAQQILATMK